MSKSPPADFWAESITIQNALWMSDRWVATPYSASTWTRREIAEGTVVDVLDVSGVTYVMDITVFEGEDVRGLDFSSRRVVLLSCRLPDDLIPTPVLRTRTIDYFHEYVSCGGAGIFLFDLGARYEDPRSVYAVAKYVEINVVVSDFNAGRMTLSCRGRNEMLVNLVDIDIPDGMPTGPELLGSVGSVWLFGDSEVGYRVRWIDWLNIPVDSCGYVDDDGCENWDEAVSEIRERKVQMYSEQTKQLLGVL
tara:strand:+ start:138 stop:887 length:750 start_codon:yes stop_codon:yes gene_type:complete